MAWQQSVLAPAGSHAEAIATLTWILFGGAAVISIGVFVLAVLAYWGRPGLRRRLASTAFVFYGGVIFPVVTLTVLLVYGLMLTGTRVLATGTNVLHIEVTGEQWWWRVHYLASDTTPAAVTANEIRIPVGRDIDIKLTSADVIHSFWVPNLAGKVDMIPGVINRIRVRATAPGTFRGQCAEYCGGAHALMAFHVVALEPAVFETWLATQAGPAANPATALQKRGEALFLAAGCHACHAIRGTAAAATIGPDLTHVGGRLALGAAVLPNDANSFAQWIRDNQLIKPNNRMPPFGIFSEPDLRALAAYLESLR